MKDNFSDEKKWGEKILEIFEKKSEVIFDKKVMSGYLVHPNCGSSQMTSDFNRGKFNGKIRRKYTDRKDRSNWKGSKVGKILKSRGIESFMESSSGLWSLAALKVIRIDENGYFEPNLVILGLKYYIWCEMEESKNETIQFFFDPARGTWLKSLVI